jgi:RHS repeat-associated protein
MTVAPAIRAPSVTRRSVSAGPDCRLRALPEKGGNTVAEQKPSYTPDADQVGTISKVMDSAAAVANAYEYDAFGVARSAIETFENPYRFAGKPLDADSGLYHFIARQYQPELGRFSTVDRFLYRPRRYTYVLSRTTRAVDPAGLSPSDILPYIVGFDPYLYPDIQSQGPNPGQHHAGSDQRGAEPKSAPPSGVQVVTHPSKKKPCHAPKCVWGRWQCGKWELNSVVASVEGVIGGIGGDFCTKAVCLWDQLCKRSDNCGHTEGKYGLQLTTVGVNHFPCTVVRGVIVLPLPYESAFSYDLDYGAEFRPDFMNRARTACKGGTFPT